MKVTASLNNYGRPARKMRDLIVLVKGLEVKKALAQLAAVSRFGARDLEKLIESAVANAKSNFNLDEDSLKVLDVVIDGGAVLKRWMPRAYGNANRILKRTCSVEVVLEGEDIKKGKKLVKKDSKKKEEVSLEEKSAEKDETDKTDESKKDRKNWQAEKEDLKDEQVAKSGQNWSKKVFRRKSF